ncbi:MAG: type III secretion system translocon subunit SctE [Candidatus Competibacteraceae bacterium]|jgi:hypothetical protein|nr:type III secretion system translocon subunit SctE [Candidatus Competibacteraceae bacterium]
MPDRISDHSSNVNYTPQTGGDNVQVNNANQSPWGGNLNIEHLVSDYLKTYQNSGAGASAPVLDSPSTDIGVESLGVEVTSLVADRLENGMRAANNSIKADMKRSAEETKKRIQDLLDSVKKMAKSKKAGKWAKAFSFVGAVVGIAVGVAVMAAAGWTGVGAVAGACIIAASGIALGMAIAQSVPASQEWMQKHPAFGYAMMAVQILLAVCSMGAGIYAAATSIGTEVAVDTVEDGLELTEQGSELAESGTNAAEDGSQIAEDGAEIAEDGASAGESTQETVQQTAQKTFLKALKGYLSSIQFYATLAQAATQAGGGAAGIVSDVAAGEAGQDQSDALDHKANMVELENFISDETAFAAKLNKAWTETFKLEASMLQSTHKTRTMIF